MPRRIASRFEISEEMIANGAQLVMHQGMPIAPTRIVAPMVDLMKNVRTMRTAKAMCEKTQARRSVIDFICRTSSDCKNLSKSVLGVPFGVWDNAK